MGELVWLHRAQRAERRLTVREAAELLSLSEREFLGLGLRCEWWGGQRRYVESAVRAARRAA